MLINEIQYLGNNLQRPEYVLCLKDGSFLTPDSRGGVSLINPSGENQLILAKNIDRPFLPNGFSRTIDGKLLISNLAPGGGVFLFDMSGLIEPFLEEADGCRLNSTIFVLIDKKERTWIIVPTRKEPRSLAFHGGVSDGFIVLTDVNGTRIVEDGLGYPNEIRISPDSKHAYITETFGRRLLRFDIEVDGKLTNKTVITSFSNGTFPDGLALDCKGGIWIASVISNRLIRVDNDGAQSTVLEDSDPTIIAEAERLFYAGGLSRDIIKRSAGNILPGLSSVAFFGLKLNKIALGFLHGDRIGVINSPYSGLPMAY